jgi:pimeloyl-ACP methyl ester carboxylesterase
MPADYASAAPLRANLEFGRGVFLGRQEEHGNNDSIAYCMGKEPMGSLILIPGLLCNQLLWSNQLPKLARNADVVIADLTRQETIAAMAASVLDAAPARFSLAGFSLGSQVALEIMRTAADRVERLALLSATHGGLLPPVENALRHAIETIEQGGFDDYLEAAYPSYFSAARAHDTELKSMFLEMAHSVGQEAGLRQMRALLTIQGSFRNLEKIRCPTVVIGGAEDHRTTPAAHKALAAEIPGSKLLLLEVAAHFTPLEVPNSVTEALDAWLTT